MPACTALRESGATAGPITTRRVTLSRRHCAAVRRGGPEGPRLLQPEAAALQLHRGRLPVRRVDKLCMAWLRLDMEGLRLPAAAVKVQPQ